MIEFKKDGTAVELGPDFLVVHENLRQGWVLVSNKNQAFEILTGKKRDKALAAYEADQQSITQPATIVQPAMQPVQVVKQSEPELEEQQPTELLSEEDEAALFEETVESIGKANELFQPQKDEWFTAYFVRVSDKILIFRLTTGDRVACRPRLITQSPGGHSFCLREGTEAAIRIEVFDGKYRALECVIEGDPPAKEEIARIKNWNGCGWAERPCGCWIYVAYASRGREGICGFVGVGDWVRFTVEPSKTRSGTFVGVDAERIEPPEGEEKSYGI